MIENLSSKSRVTEVNDVSTQLSGAFDNSEITDPNLVNIFTGLKASNLNLTLAINRSQAESELDASDLVRDDVVRALYYLLWGYSHHPTEEIRLTAELLLKVFDKYGMEMIRESYATESSLISSMLLEYGKPEYSEAITALSGCGELIESLAISQNNFEQLRIAFETDKAIVGMQDNATTIKKEVVDIINKKVVSYLCAMSQLNADTYALFTNICAQIIDDNNEQVKKRQKKPEPGQESKPETKPDTEQQE